MENGRPSQRPAVLEPWDTLVREPLPPDEPRPGGKLVVLSALAALLVVTLVGTTALVLRDLRAQGSPSMSTTLSVQATSTATVTPTPTTPPRSPQDNGWTEYTAGVTGGRVVSGDVKFSASSPQRGYLCGWDNSGRIIFGLTIDGGQTWVVGPSPAAAANGSCSIQVSPSNALDIALTSVPGSCGGDSCFSSDAHYSTDGGKTWRAAPIPSNTFRLGGALWSGAYLYIWSGEIDSGPQPQHGFLKVSANGGAFASIDLSTLLPGAQNVSIGSVVASGTKLYLNLTYTGCSSQNCLAIVASGDGGKTWTPVPNQSSIQLMAVAAYTLYGQAPDPQVPQTLAEWTSSDSGATWTRLELPPLPGGQPIPLCLPGPDGTFVGQLQTLDVAYLRDGAWTILPFSTDASHLAVSLDASGKPKAVWAADDGNGSWAGIYWHALP